MFPNPNPTVTTYHGQERANKYRSFVTVGSHVKGAFVFDRLEGPRGGSEVKLCRAVKGLDKWTTLVQFGGQ